MGDHNAPWFHEYCVTNKLNNLISPNLSFFSNICSGLTITVWLKIHIVTPQCAKVPREFFRTKGPTTWKRFLRDFPIMSNISSAELQSTFQPQGARQYCHVDEGYFSYCWESAYNSTCVNTCHKPMYYHSYTRITIDNYAGFIEIQIEIRCNTKVRDTAEVCVVWCYFC